MLSIDWLEINQKSSCSSANYLVVSNQKSLFQGLKLAMDKSDRGNYLLVFGILEISFEQKNTIFSSKISSMRTLGRISMLEIVFSKFLSNAKKFLTSYTSI